MQIYRADLTPFSDIGGAFFLEEVSGVDAARMVEVVLATQRHLNTTKPNADPSAARLPASVISPELSANLIAMPPMATAIAMQVAVRTNSRRMTHPRAAAIKGAVGNSTMALATEVAGIE